MPIHDLSATLPMSPSPSSTPSSSDSSPTRLPVIEENSESCAPEDVSDSDESEFGELSSVEFTSASYISFGEPTFSSSIYVNQRSHVDTVMMEASQNFNTINYPVFKKYGYYVNGTYYAMVKKGTTRDRPKCLYRRGTPRLETIKEEPEQEEPKQEDKENINPKKAEESNKHC